MDDQQRTMRSPPKGGSGTAPPKLHEELTKLGNDAKFVYAEPSVNILECFPNPQPAEDYTVVHDTTEFTSLCPKTGQPDYAKVFIAFTPAEKCVETKSLKLYLVAFRNTGQFMEAICNRVFNDLMEVMQPKRLRVLFQFAARGGIATTVERAFPNAGVGLAGPSLYAEEVD